MPGPTHKNLCSREKEQEVWESFLKGDKEAFSELYLLFFDRLYLYGCSIVEDKALVKDAIQDIFVKLLQREKELLQIHNINSYLFVALRNHLKKSLIVRSNHQNHREIYAQGQSTVQEPFQSFSDPPEIDLQKAVRLEINALPTRQREILFLRFFNGFDYKEIAEILSINHQVTRNYAHRGVKKLRKKMSGFYRDLLNLMQVFVFLMAKLLDFF